MNGAKICHTMVSPGCCLGTDVMHIDDICSRLRCSPCGSNGPGLETHPRESEREMLWLEKVKEKKTKKTEFPKGHGEQENVLVRPSK